MELALNERFYEVDFDALYDIDGGKFKWSWKKFAKAVVGGICGGVFVGSAVNVGMGTLIGGAIGGVGGAVKYILTETWD